MTNEKEKILIADDEEQLRVIESMIFGDAFPQFEVESFSDGTSLEKRLTEDIGNVRLVVTDNNMPGITGSEIIEKYAKRPEYAGLKFILAYAGDDKIGKRAVENGAFSFIQKPADLDTYLDVARKALNL